MDKQSGLHLSIKELEDEHAIDKVNLTASRMWTRLRIWAKGAVIVLFNKSASISGCKNDPSGL